jgi:hypothetical protein
MVSVRAALLSFVIAAAALAQPHHATFVLSGDRVLVALPDSILRGRAVRTRLESALTTTFILRARTRGTTSESITRIEIRYDLWDEVYRTRRLDATAQPALQTVARTQLEAWWHTPIDVVHLAGDRATIDVELIVLPFSAAEESDAREWLSKSGGARDPSSDSKSVVDALIGTTLTARPIVAYKWLAEIVRR